MAYAINCRTRGSGSTPKGGEAAYKPFGTPFIRSMNVVFFGFKREGLAYIDDEQASALKNVEVKAGDVLLNITGASIGRVTRAPSDLDGARVNQHVCIIRPEEVLDARYLNAYFSSPAMQEKIWADNYGVTRQALTKQQVLDFEIPVAPLNEQKRIADKLDAVLARVDACRERLERVPAILKRFRQSVLAAATSGRLTADWRAARAPAPHAGGSTPDFESGTGASSACVGYQSAQLVVLVAEPLRNGKSVRDGLGQKVLRLSALKLSGLDFNESKSGDWDGIDSSRFLVQTGDFLIARGNGSKELVGRGGLVDVVPEQMAYPDTMIRVRPAFNKLNPMYLKSIWDSQVIREQIESVARTTAGIWKISQGDLESLWVPLPELDEQHEIVRRVETLFAFADRLEARLATARNAADKLTPSLLAKAFRGELVPQDPNDEPAAELLKRLAASRAQAGEKPKRGRKAKPAADPQTMELL